jgi:hypothetical protein
MNVCLDFDIPGFRQHVAILKRRWKFHGYQQGVTARHLSPRIFGGEIKTEKEGNLPNISTKSIIILEKYSNLNAQGDQESYL